MRNTCTNSIWWIHKDSISFKQLQVARDVSTVFLESKRTKMVRVSNTEKSILIHFGLRKPILYPMAIKSGAKAQSFGGSKKVFCTCITLISRILIKIFIIKYFIWAESSKIRNVMRGVFKVFSVVSIISKPIFLIMNRSCNGHVTSIKWSYPNHYENLGFEEKGYCGRNK